MSRQDTILYLREDADNRQKELAQTLGRQRALLHEIQNKLQLLENYLAQYREQAVAAEQAGILSAQAMEMRSFIAQLEQVLKLQRENLQHQQQQVRWLQGEWAAARGRGKGLASLAQRLENEQRNQALRKMQKDLDEWAMRSSALRVGRVFCL
ncbi:flagellar export protein FliJ [Acidithiobacillus sp.]|uniref:flagellar export protein FliJ n=1 Tax=Acidithiobacillus sp. TaxID=1872118 RepID=UPI0025C4115E|nr:flagellar export protein FliJ [Acidithiobacillus sp.]